MLLPLYLQSVLGRSSFAAGMALLPRGLMVGILGRPAGSLFDRFGARRVLVPGSIAIAVALVCCASFDAATPLAAAICVHVLFMPSSAPRPSAWF